MNTRQGFEVTVILYHIGKDEGLFSKAGVSLHPVSYKQQNTWHQVTVEQDRFIAYLSGGRELQDRGSYLVTWKCK